MYPMIFFAISIRPPVTFAVHAARRGPPAWELDLLDLREFQLDWSGAAEDRHCHFQARPVFVHFFYRAVERGERPIRDTHLLPDLECDRGLGPLSAFLHLVQNAVDFALSERH